MKTKPAKNKASKKSSKKEKAEPSILRKGSKVWVIVSATDNAPPLLRQGVVLKSTAAAIPSNGWYSDMIEIQVEGYNESFFYFGYDLGVDTIWKFKERPAAIALYQAHLKDWLSRLEEQVKICNKKIKLGYKELQE